MMFTDMAMKTMTQAVVYWVGILPGAGGPAALLGHDGDHPMTDERAAEICLFCAARGLKHNRW